MAATHTFDLCVAAVLRGVLAVRDDPATRRTVRMLDIQQQRLVPVCTDSRNFTQMGARNWGEVAQTSAARGSRGVGHARLHELGRAGPRAGVIGGFDRFWSRMRP